MTLIEIGQHVKALSVGRITGYVRGYSVLKCRDVATDELYAIVDLDSECRGNVNSGYISLLVVHIDNLEVIP